MNALNESLASDQRRPVPAGMARAVMLLAAKVGGVQLECGMVIDAPRGAVRQLVKRGVVDDHPRAISAAFADALAKKAILEAQLERSPSGAPQLVWETIRWQIQAVEQRLHVHVVKPYGEATNEPEEPQAITVPAVEEREAFVEAEGILRALMEDQAGTTERIRVVENELRNGGRPQQVNLVELALSGKPAPAMSVDTLRDELLQLREHLRIVERAVAEQGQKLERARSAAAATTLQELVDERAAIARDVVAGIEALQRAHALERQIEQALRRGGYGAERVPPLSVLARLPMDVEPLLSSYAKDALEFIEQAEAKAERKGKAK